MPAPDPCALALAEAMETRCRLEAFRLIELTAGDLGEAALRSAVNHRRDQLRAWSVTTLGIAFPEVSRIGYAPPWSTTGSDLFGPGMAWVDLHNPRHLHPLPHGHQGIPGYLERAIRAEEKIPGIAQISPPLRAAYASGYQRASVAFDAQTDALRQATEAHRTVRSALLAARRKRARNTGAPVRLVTLSELLAIEADAGEAAFKTLLDWLAANCGPEGWKAIPTLTASHRFPPAD